MSILRFHLRLLMDANIRDAEDITERYNVFVGDLSPDVNDEVLAKAFSAFGALSDVRVTRDPHSGKSYGYLTFGDKADAQRAIDSMNGKRLGSGFIRLNWAIGGGGTLRPGSAGIFGVAPIPTSVQGGLSSSPFATKDLSHVPCKFFKVGACTTGSSCPFSHVVHAPGRESRSSRGGKKDSHRSALPHGTSSTGSGMLSGPIAPTRTTSARPPTVMTLKATPSTPTPPDTDLPPFVLPDDADTHKHGNNNDAPPTTATPESTSAARQDEESPLDPPLDTSSSIHHRNPSPPALPLNVPGAPRHTVLPADIGNLGPRTSVSVSQTKAATPYIEYVNPLLPFTTADGLQ